MFVVEKFAQKKQTSRLSLSHSVLNISIFPLFLFRSDVEVEGQKSDELIDS